MKPIPILGLGGVPVSDIGTLPTSYEGRGGILSAALALPDDEHARRHRMLERYLAKRAGFIHAGNDTIH
jgi:hypothetical protein